VKDGRGKRVPLFFKEADEGDLTKALVAGK